MVVGSQESFVAVNDAVVESIRNLFDDRIFKLQTALFSQMRCLELNICKRMDSIQEQVTAIRCPSGSSVVDHNFGAGSYQPPLALSCRPDSCNLDTSINLEFDGQGVARPIKVDDENLAVLITAAGSPATCENVAKYKTDFISTKLDRDGTHGVEVGKQSKSSTQGQENAADASFRAKAALLDSSSHCSPAGDAAQWDNGLTADATVANIVGQDSVGPAQTSFSRRSNECAISAQPKGLPVSASSFSSFSASGRDDGAGTRPPRPPPPMAAQAQPLPRTSLDSRSARQSFEVSRDGGLSLDRRWPAGSAAGSLAGAPALATREQLSVIARVVGHMQSGPDGKTVDPDLDAGAEHHATGFDHHTQSIFTREGFLHRVFGVVCPAPPRSLRSFLSRLTFPVPRSFCHHLARILHPPFFVLDRRGRIAGAANCLLAEMCICLRKNRANQATRKETSKAAQAASAAQTTSKPARAHTAISSPDISERS